MEVRGHLAAWHVVRTLLLAVAVVAAALLVWKLSSLLLLVFGAVLVALLLRAFADVIDAHTPIHGRWSLLTATLLIVLVLAGFTLVTGAQLAQQFTDLLGRLPQLTELLRERLGISNLEAVLEERLGRIMSSGGFLSSIAGYSAGIVGALANLFLVLVAGIYLAVNPVSTAAASWRSYRRPSGTRRPIRSIRFPAP